MNYSLQVLYHTIANVSYLAVQWLLSVIVTRVMNIEMVGYLTFAISVTNIFFSIQTYGMRSYQVSDAVGEFSSEQYVGARVISCLLGVFLCVGFLVVSDHSAIKSGGVLLFFLFRTWEAFSDVLFGEMQKSNQLNRISHSFIIRSVTTLVMFTVSSLITRSLIISLAMIVATSMMVTLIFDWKSYRLFVRPERVTLHFGESIAPLKVCFFLMITLLFPMMITSLPRMILDQYYGAEVLGYFGNVAMPTTLIVAIVPNILTPITTMYGRWIYAGEIKQLMRMFWGTILGTACLYGCCVLGVKLLGDPVMTLIYTENIRPYLHYLYPLLFTTTLYGMTMCVNAVLISLRCNKAVLLCSGFALILCIVFSYMQIETRGINGVILTMGVAYGGQLAMQFLCVYRALKKVLKKHYV